MNPSLPFLELKNVTKRFPGVTALQAVNLTVERGEVHVLLGENGAGKSSLVKLLAGIYQPDEGEISFEGKPYRPHTTIDAFHAGIRVVHQELNLLPSLSVAENLLFESLPQQHGVVKRGELNQRARALLNEVGLTVSPKTRVDQLGIAQMQLVEIAKALCNESKLLILDEPTATLTPPEIERLFSIIKRLQAKGVTFIYISHRLQEIYQIASRVTVLRNGQHIATRAIEGLTLNEIVKMMVGRELHETARLANGSATETEMFRVEGLKRGVHNPLISFSVRKGEILGVAGLVGSGRTETMRAIFGADPKTGGEFYLEGQRIYIHNPRDAVQHGLCLLTEDRKNQGLMLDLPLSVNITITDLAKVSHLGLRKKKAELKASGALIRELHIKTASVRQFVRNLSGGNQQKVVVAKWLFCGSRVLIFDEPTRGIDIGAKEEIYDLLMTLAAQGKAIIMVSSDLPELMAVCHRIIVFSKGKIVGEVDHAHFDQEQIIALAYQEHIQR